MAPSSKRKRGQIKGNPGGGQEQSRGYKILSWPKASDYEVGDAMPSRKRIVTWSTPVVFHYINFM
jgi:hypothetical protein